MLQIFFFLFLSALPLVCEASPPAPVTQCTDWARITFPDYYLHNNVWGKRDIQGYKQCLFLEEGKDGDFGWTWEWPTGAPDVVAYPEVLFGHSPWNPESTTPLLPCAIGKLKKARITYDLTMEAAGIYNLAFDAWLCSEEKPTEKAITAEIMIWLTHQTLRPDGTSDRCVTLDGEAYDFYHGKPPHAGWPYLAFIKKDDRVNQGIDLRKFLDFLVREKYVQPQEFLACIDFGNEVVEGKGRTAFKRYKVEIKR